MEARSAGRRRRPVRAELRHEKTAAQEEDAREGEERERGEALCVEGSESESINEIYV